MRDPTSLATAEDRTRTSASLEGPNRYGGILNDLPRLLPPMEHPPGSTRPRTVRIAAALSLSLVAILAILAGCTSPSTDDGGASGDEKLVRMVNTAYDPAVLSVPVGTTVKWVNDDPYGHTVTPYDKVQWGTDGSGDDAGDWLQKGDSWSFTFTEPGTYKYYCKPHAFSDGHGGYSGMTGTVVVTEGDGAAPADVATKVVPSPVAPPPTGRSEPAEVSITLETKEVVAQLADGVAYEFWTFGGTVPGPMHRVRVGDTVHVTLKNDAGSQHPHSVDFHAVTGPGGGAKATQTEPGKETSFTFQALNPGLYVYHCATPHIPTHIANGMYGLILVEPEEGLPPVDREYFVVQGEVYTEGAVGEPGMQAFSLGKLLDEDAEYFLMNGRVGALTGAGALQADVNETVRIYFGVGGFVPSSFHVIGEIFDRVWQEGSMTEPDTDVQTTLVPAGGSTIVEFKAEVPGDYLLVDHWLTHAIDRGAVGILHVAGEADPTVFQPGA